MAGSRRPGETGESGPVGSGGGGGKDGDLDRRLRSLEASIEARRQEERGATRGGGRGAATGYGQAFKLSSEFIAGIAVGIGLGWFFDRLAGTSPWGLIVFLLLGFGAGVLNVLRSAGKVAQPGSKSQAAGGSEPEAK